MAYWLMLMVFVQGASPSVTHVGSFANSTDCSAAQSEAISNITILEDHPVRGVDYRVLCIRASDGKVAAPTPPR